MTDIRIGNGFDVHAFKEGRELIIGGEKIDYPFGLDGHSDADVLTHSIIDSLLGAAGLGDIGMLFPDNDPKFKNIRSIKLLQEVGLQLKNNRIKVINVDSVVICQKPKIADYVDKMKDNISSALGTDFNRIGIKGKTTEKLGFTGREEGIAVYSVALVDLNG